MNPNPLARNPLARNPRVPAATAAIKGWTRTALGIGSEVVIFVNELACSQPDCPPRETVVLILPAGVAPRRLSIHKAIVDVCEHDVVQACLLEAEILQAKGGNGAAE